MSVNCWATDILVAVKLGAVMADLKTTKISGVQGRVPGHVPVPRYRVFLGHILFTQGFRPFFLLAGVWAPLALALFVASIEGWLSVPTALDPIAWHFHEMIFGFVVAAMAGFLLTAIPNWTGRLPLQGVPLIVLVVLWLGGRLAMATSAIIGNAAAAVIDIAFLAVLLTAITREILAGKNWRNLPIVIAVGVLLAGNVIFHAGQLDLYDDTTGPRLIIAVVIILISVIGGRIIPSFTRNWLAARKAKRLPAPTDKFDLLTLAVTIFTLAWWTIFPFAEMTGILALVSSLLNAVRLSRWLGLSTTPEALVWVLHLGFVWIPVGLFLIGISNLWGNIPQIVAVHAFTAGAMGTMILAVMSRATLGHTGHSLTASPLLTLAYVLLTLSVMVRVAAPFFAVVYLPMLLVAAAAWISAFVFFLVSCGPHLLRPKRKQA